ncbi:MAG: prepilin-type N-terminal cleavage/methylation domain-containing protein, partial [Lachnospiraceae bacterium]|nr:prepilin-type N-terminal cleavage/methylation domain-containing protein [Lachnospiraceae bacterium]
MLNKAIKKAKENKKGFTLAELLIVVAIIAVLVAISIPIFTTQLEKSRDAVSIANIRAAYAEASAAMLTSNGKAVTEGNVSVAAPDGGKVVVTVSNVVLKGTKPGDKFSNL